MKKLIYLLFTLYLYAHVNILNINSYDATFSWTYDEFSSIYNTLKKSQFDFNEYSEFMKTKKFKPTPKYFDFLNSVYCNLYANKKFDVVIVTDDNALNFVRKYINKPYLKNSKIFFCGINNLSLKDKLDKSRFAGVFEAKDPIKNLKLAKAIYPNLKTVYLIFDNSTSARKIIKIYKKAYQNIKGINFVYLNDSNIDHILDVLKNADKDSIGMFLTVFAFEKDSKPIDAKEAAFLISKVYNKPLIIHTDTIINLPNVIGGNCTSGKRQGEEVAKKVIEYLGGKDMREIGFLLKSPNEWYFNYKTAQKFGINLSEVIKKLNIKHYVIVNKPISLWEEYKVYIISFFALFFLIVLLLVVVVVKNREIRKINDELDERIKKAIEENTKILATLQNQAKLAAMGEMIGAIAHQWRQPLNALAINIQLLEDLYEEGELDKKTFEEIIKKSMDAINFMSNTIDDFRNFFRKDKEKQEFDVKEVIEKTLSLQLPQLKNHNIEVELELDSVKILGYKNEFMQVILNLISNSKDAIEEKRKQVGDFKGIIKIKTEIDNDKLILKIKDNGIGIKKDIKDRIFEPYFTTKEEGEGTGMGLYMVKQILKRINAQIKVNPTEEGAEFIVIIPIKKD